MNNFGPALTKTDQNYPSFKLLWLILINSVTQKLWQKSSTILLSWFSQLGLEIWAIFKDSLAVSPKCQFSRPRSEEVRIFTVILPNTVTYWWPHCKGTNILNDKRWKLSENIEAQRAQYCFSGSNPWTGRTSLATTGIIVIITWMPL